MIKLVGTCIITLSCGALGFYKAFAMNRRRKNILAFETAMELLEGEIDFARNNLHTALINIATDAGTGKIFMGAAKNMEQTSIKKAWSDAVETVYRELYFTEEDKSVIKLLGNNLGQSDAQSQVNNIRYVKALAHKQYEEAYEEYNRSAKMYKSFGVLAGLMISILFF